MIWLSQFRSLDNDNQAALLKLLQAGEVLFQHLINCAVSSQAIVMISYVRKAAWLQAGEVLFQHSINCAWAVKVASALAEFGKEGREPDASYISYTYMVTLYSDIVLNW